MFRIVLDSGHGMHTPGKRCLKSLDANETREWFLNNRICVLLEKKLEAYQDYELIRVDDRSGKTDVPLSTRVNKANSFDADIYLSTHHNAGLNGKKGGGILSLVCLGASEKSKEYQKIIYDEVIKTTNHKGNRTEPMAEQNLYVCRKTTMPAVLVEFGFMDGPDDVPLILSEKYANDAAEGLLNALVKIGELTKKTTEEVKTDKIYRVQVGAYSVKANAEAMQNKLKADGYDAIIVQGVTS